MPLKPLSYRKVKRKLEAAVAAYQEYLEGRDQGKSLEELKAELDY